METMDSEILNQNPTRLNEQQMQMLQLFKTPMSSQEYEEIKKHILQIKAKKLGADIDNWEKDNNITMEAYDNWEKENMRTSYKRLP